MTFFMTRARRDIFLGLFRIWWWNLIKSFVFSLHTHREIYVNMYACMYVYILCLPPFLFLFHHLSLVRVIGTILTCFFSFKVIWIKLSDISLVAWQQKLCYVAADYEAELLKDTKASFEAVEGLFTLSKERFQTGEILFQPRLAGV